MSDNTTRRFQWILQTVPDWWVSMPGINVHVSTSTAVLPGGVVVEPGDFIVRAADGSLSVEVDHEGRIQAQRFLASLREQDSVRSIRASRGEWVKPPPHIVV